MKRCAGALLLSCACLASAQEREKPAASPAAPWKTVTVGPVSLRVPPQFREENLSVDSRMYRYRDGASEVTVDYGQYTSGIALERNPRFRNWRKWTERIGGRRARLVTYQDGGRYHAVALWENLRPHRHLFMDARSSDSRLPLEIVRTVKFAR